MSVDFNKLSVAQWFNEREQHRCGYCTDPCGSVSYGMMAQQLTVQDYKALIDRGWRRSGKYCYKPIMDKTCCPQYTIRCDALNFKMNKSHKKIIKKFNKFLNDGHLNKASNLTNIQDSNVVQHELQQGASKANEINLQRDVVNNIVETPKCERNTVENNFESFHEVMDTTSVENKSKNEEILDKTAKKSYKEGTGIDPTKPPCKKAKLLRIERKKDKLLRKNDETEAKPNQLNNTQKSLSDFIDEKCLMESAKKNLRIKLVQMTSQEESYKRSYELFKKYQISVHNDQKCSISDYHNFLVSTPLMYEPFPNNDDSNNGYGSFHQQYWIDNELIAVGVIDILPECVSSVYFFYDPDYRDLTLGTYGSLREINFVQNLHQSKVETIKYYYMGYYIHSCPKMRYKGKLIPSDLLCSETYLWFPIEKCLSKLDISKYSRLNCDLNYRDSNKCDSSIVNRMKVIYDYKLMYVENYLTLENTEENSEDFDTLADLIGKELAFKIVFWIN